MTIKRLILILLTVFALVKISLSLIGSWWEPQIQSRLELSQTNLLLYAAEWQEKNSPNSTQPGTQSNLTIASSAIVGNEPFKAAEKQYQEARESAAKTRSQIKSQLEKPKRLAVTTESEGVPNPQSQVLQTSINQLERLIDELDLRLGIIKVRQGDTNIAVKNWAEFSAERNLYVDTANILINLWNKTPEVLPNAETQIKKDLDGWFRDRALVQLYQLQERQSDLAQINAQIQEKGKQSVIKLAIIAGIPGFGFLIGIGLLIFLAIGLITQGRRSLLAQDSTLSWDTPWDWEIIWQVFVLGFFFVGQILLPLVFSLLPFDPSSFDIRLKAFYVLASYLFLTAGGLGVLFLSLKPFFPLPKGWFRIAFLEKWFLWGFGGYFVALPLVIVVSLINQKLWQGQGGSNPILEIALQGKDQLALAIFFLTAAVAAPIFEEVLFRGFLLPSLTRYLPEWGAIVVSSLLFAIAHLSLSEVAPLAILGMVLGFVYMRSRNLLAPMLLHSLWNSGTLLSLFVLGSGTN